MPVKRLGVASPAAYTNAFTLLATADVACVASVIVANKGNIRHYPGLEMIKNLYEKVI